MNSLGAVLFVLLPIIGSGYLLYSTQLMRSLLPDTYRSNHYFRILLLGFFWVLLCDLVLAQIPGLPEIIARWGSFIFATQIPVEEKTPGSWEGFIFGAQISLVRMSLPLLLAAVMNVLIDFLFPGCLPDAKRIKHRMQSRTLINKDAELMYYKAAFNLDLLMITTSSKVYIGWVGNMSVPKGDRQWLPVFPTQIGYWDDKQKLQVTADYVDEQENYSNLLAEGADPKLLARQEISRPMAIISVKEIVSIQRFSFARYNKEFLLSDDNASK